MKRVAGEDGRCFMTEETMCKRNRIGKETLHKSLKYLIDHKWIKFVGTTPSKTRPVKTYKVLDVWKQNSDFYQDKKIRSETALSKDTACKQKDTAVLGGKIPPEKGGIRRTNNKEEPIKKKYSSLSDLTGNDFREIAEKYDVPISFVKSKYEDMYLWEGEKAGRGKGRNWRLTLMNWVKRDALKVRQDFSNANNKRSIDASNL